MEPPTCKKELVIEVPDDVVAREREQIAAQYARVARIPGFRPGHAPRALVAKRFHDEIRSEVVQNLVPKYFADSIRDQNLVVAGEPHFEDLQLEEGRPIRAKASFEVYPEIELKEYKGLEVEQEPATVTDSEVDEAIERLRQGAATFEVIEDRAAADGDFALVSYKGQDLKNVGAEPLEVTDGLIEIGGPGVVWEFTQNLRGSVPDEVREFEANYPDDFSEARLAGRRLRYRVEVQGIKKRVLAAVDDELAKTVSELSSLAELRQQLRRDLDRRKQRQVEDAVKHKLLEKVIANHDFPLPETLVESQVRRQMQSVIRGMIAQGVDPRAPGIDWSRVRGDMKPEAEQEVRGNLILDKVASDEKIDISEAEIDDALREIAAAAEETPAALKTRLTREHGLDRLKSGIRRQKALDFIYHHAKVNHQTTLSGSEGESSAKP
ncbi:MAG TPA: trigger factor [Terriglobia bacterium]